MAEAPRPAIIDTNIVVAGLIGQREDSPVARLFDGMLDGAFAFVISPALLAEYRRVLLRRKIAALHRLPPARIDELLTEIVRHAIVLEPAATALRAPDANDQHLWDLLAAHAAVVLVSGDKRLLVAADFPGRIFSPASFASSIEHD